VLVERLEFRRRQKDARRVSHEQFERIQAGVPRRVRQRLGGGGSHPLQFRVRSADQGGALVPLWHTPGKTADTSGMN